MTKNSPLESQIASAFCCQRDAADHERRASEATDPQWKLYHEKKAAMWRAQERSYIAEAYEYAGLLVAPHHPKP
mgnify:CR=1 FL=1